jgi:hypothetical protein
MDQAPQAGLRDSRLLDAFASDENVGARTVSGLLEILKPVSARTHIERVTRMLIGRTPIPSRRPRVCLRLASSS